MDIAEVLILHICFVDEHVASQIPRNKVERSGIKVWGTFKVVETLHRS